MVDRVRTDLSIEECFPALCGRALSLADAAFAFHAVTFLIYAKVCQLCLHTLAESRHTAMDRLPNSTNHKIMRSKLF